MTREEAKRVLKSLDYCLQNRFEDYGERNHDAMIMAIKALEQYPRFRACANCDNAGEDTFACYECEDYSNFEAKPKEKIGHWQKISADKYSEHVAYYFRCSECGKDIIGEHNYCPNCGCRMEGSGKE